MLSLAMFGFGATIATWVFAGIALPLALPWAWNLPLASWGRLGDALGMFIIMFNFMVWPSSILLWDTGRYMPALLRFPLFWQSVGINVLIYAMVGFFYWGTANRFYWIRYVVGGFWLSVCLGIPATALPSLISTGWLAFSVWAIVTLLITRWTVLHYRRSHRSMSESGAVQGGCIDEVSMNSDKWIAYIDVEVRSVCASKGLRHQLRRKWAVRDKPVSESLVDDYEWKLISGEFNEPDPDHYEGSYYILYFNPPSGRFVLQHDNHQCGEGIPRLFTTYTVFEVLGSLEKIPQDGWLHDRLVHLVSRFGPNIYSYT